MGPALATLLLDSGTEKGISPGHFPLKQMIWQAHTSILFLRLWQKPATGQPGVATAPELQRELAMIRRERMACDRDGI